ncbi:MAG TPA: hypothetical protein VFB01_17780 [Burkholderiales bacterium]|nr:hypothetical protein [Burkholderiales bacterium]
MERARQAKETRSEGKASPLTTAALNNPQIVTVAVYVLGGDRRYVDTEDVAVKANELAPRRFAWRKHPDQINLELVRVYLSDAKKPEHGEYLRGSGNEGWMLTAEGLAYARQAARRLDPGLLARVPMSPAERRQHARERRRLLATEAYAKFRAGHLGEVSRREAETFFRVDDYVVGAARERKIDRLLAMFSNDAELGEASRAIATILRQPSRDP